MTTTFQIDEACYGFESEDKSLVDQVMEMAKGGYENASGKVTFTCLNTGSPNDDGGHDDFRFVFSDIKIELNDDEGLSAEDLIFRGIPSSIFGEFIERLKALPCIDGTDEVYMDETEVCE